MHPVHIVSIFALAISSNFDNLGVGLAYGMRGICISFRSNLVIAVLNSLGTLFAMLAGNWIFALVQPRISQLAGGSMIIAVGVTVIVQGIVKTGRGKSADDAFRIQSEASIPFPLLRKVWSIVMNPFNANPVCLGSMGAWETVLIGLGLTMSNLVTGFAAGLMGLNIFILTGVTLLFSIMAIAFGAMAGNSRTFRWLGRYSGIVSGSLLVMIGGLEIIF